MQQLCFKIEKREEYYELTLQESQKLIFFNKEELWMSIYSIAKDIDFNATHVQLQELNIKTIESLVAVFRNIVDNN